MHFWVALADGIFLVWGALCLGAGLQLWFLLLKPSIPTKHPDPCGHIWVRGGERSGSAGAAATQTWGNALMRDGTMSLVPWVRPPPISDTLCPPGTITEHLLVTAASTTLVTAQFPSWMGHLLLSQPKAPRGAWELPNRLLLSTSHLNLPPDRSKGRDEGWY